MRPKSLDTEKRLFGTAFGCFGAFFLFVLAAIITGWCVMGFVGYKVWNAPVVQEFIEGEEKEP